MFSDLLEQPQSSPDTAGQSQRILIIDEDANSVAQLVRRLEGQGFRTLTASTAAGGLELARVSRPSVILLDLWLPDADGLKVCRELVDSPATCGIPVIALSGREYPEILRRCRAAGCHFYVRKPYDPNVLLVLIRQAINDTLRWREVG